MSDFPTTTKHMFQVLNKSITIDNPMAKNNVFDTLCFYSRGFTSGVWCYIRSCHLGETLSGSLCVGVWLAIHRDGVTGLAMLPFGLFGQATVADFMSKWQVFDFTMLREILNFSDLIRISVESFTISPWSLCSKNGCFTKSKPEMVNAPEGLNIVIYLSPWEKTCQCLA